MREGDGEGILLSRVWTNNGPPRRRKQTEGSALLNIREGAHSKISIEAKPFVNVVA